MPLFWATLSAWPPMNPWRRRTPRPATQGLLPHRSSHSQGLAIQEMQLHWLSHAWRMVLLFRTVTPLFQTLLPAWVLWRPRGGDHRGRPSWSCCAGRATPDGGCLFPSPRVLPAEAPCQGLLSTGSTRFPGGVILGYSDSEAIKGLQICGQASSPTSDSEALEESTPAWVPAMSKSSCGGNQALLARASCDRCPEESNEAPWIWGA